MLYQVREAKSGPIHRSIHSSGQTGLVEEPNGIGFWWRPASGRRPGGSDQTPQVLGLAGPDAPQGHRQHDRQRHADAQLHLRQPADARSLEPEAASQAAVDPLHRAALVVEVLPPVAGPRHRREHAPILAQRDAHRVAHRAPFHALAGDPRVARRAAILERLAILLEAAVGHAVQVTGLWAHAGNLAVVGVDYVLLTAHQLGEQVSTAILFRLSVLPAVANGDDRLDLMLLPQPIDQLVVVVALVSAHEIASMQQLGMTLLHLIKQPLRLRLFAARRLGDLERQRHLVGGVHHQVQQVAEPVVFLLGLCVPLTSAKGRATDGSSWVRSV